jgi:transcription initiation factor IIE alpha subunit
LKEKLSKKKVDIRKLMQFFVRQRLAIEVSIDEDEDQNWKKTAILFYVCAIREKGKDLFRLYICKEVNTPSDPIIESKRF